MNRMMVEIWSDVMCPFCYIGKGKFEAALAEFDNRNDIQIVWKSFQLSPGIKTDPNKNVNQFLAEHKGISLEKAIQMNDYVTQMAAQVGLVYNFEKAIVANSFDAHRFSHFAKEKGVQDEAEEKLFAAYFTEGKNTADHDILIQLGAEVGLDTTELKSVLETGKYADAVKADINEAHSLGVRGVPFFVFNRRYAVSGAQESDVFAETLQQSFADWERSKLLK